MIGCDCMNILKMAKDTKAHHGVPLEPLTTPFKVDLEDYPRPYLKRKEWVSLQGLWKLAFTKSMEIPTHFEYDIQVPFSPEARLSKVNRALKENEYLWYEKTIELKSCQRCVIHFMAVDEVCDIYLNKQLIGHHEGGYLPFQVELTNAMVVGANILHVCVRDTNRGIRGKQSRNRGGIFYTGQSGIWQPVFIEYLPKNYITDIHFESHEDLTHVDVLVESETDFYYSLFIEDRKIEGKSNQALTFELKQPHVWSLEDPYLYKVHIQLGADEIDSYFALRYYEVKDGKFYLNHHPVFLNGVLDQGYWPEGLMTAPSDQALIYDIQTMKKHGFNMMRKHVKVENARWYYHCDRLGMIVMQDMVSGGRYSSLRDTLLPTFYKKQRTKSDSNLPAVPGFEKMLMELVDYVKHFPSVAIITIFNEGWGQFDSARLTSQVKEKNILVNSASGWFDQGVGDFKSEHIYFEDLYEVEDARAYLINEYGGYAYKVDGHVSLKDGSYGYKKYETKEAFVEAYHQLMGKLHELPKVAGACFTQVSDIEEEINGILTYDRKVDKLEDDE